MTTPLAPLTLTLAAAATDSAGFHRLAFYLVLVAIVPAAISALSDTGALAEGKQVLFRVTCSAAGLLLLVFSSAVRVNATHVPPVAIAALVGSAAAFAAVTLASLVRTTLLRPMTELER